MIELACGFGRVSKVRAWGGNLKVINPHLAQLAETPVTQANIDIEASTERRRGFLWEQTNSWSEITTLPASEFKILNIGPRAIGEINADKKKTLQFMHNLYEKGLF